MSTAKSTPVPPVRVHSRAGTPVSTPQHTPLRSDNRAAAGEDARSCIARSDGYDLHCIAWPLGAPAASTPDILAAAEVPARSPLHVQENKGGMQRGKLDFSQNLERWKALESPRTHECTPAHLQAPQPSPRRESLGLTPRRNQASAGQEVAQEEPAFGPKAGTRPGSSLPYAYNFAASTQQRKRDRQAPTSEGDESRKEVDAATALGNVWSGSSRAGRSADESTLHRRALPMNMVGAFDEASELAISAPAAKPPSSSASRATWSEGAGVVLGNVEPSEKDTNAVRTSLWLSRLSPSSNGGFEPKLQISGDIGPLPAARGRQASGGFYRLEGPRATEDGRMLSHVTASTVCESPGLAMLRSSKAQVPPTSSVFGVFTSKHNSSGSDGLDMFSMRAELLQRRELLQSADRNKSAKTKSNADLPHIGPSTHSLLSLPHNASSQLAAAAATAGDYTAWKKEGQRASRAETRAGQQSAVQEAETLSRPDSCDSLDQAQECQEAAKTGVFAVGQGAGDNASRRWCQDEPPKADVQPPGLDSAQMLEWFCTRKHKKYSLHRKSRLLLIVDGAGRLRLSRCSPMLNSIENTNFSDMQPIDTCGTPAGRGMRDSYGTPAGKGMRDSHGWITSAMQSLKRHHSPVKTRSRGGKMSPLRGRPHAGDMSPGPGIHHGQACAFDGFMSEDDDFSTPSALVNTGERSPTKNGDMAVRLGGRQIQRHVIDIECVTFKEKHSVRRKLDDGGLSDAQAAPAPGSVSRSKTKDAKQEDLGKGTLMIKFKDDSCVQLSGMQVQGVAGDLLKHVSLWSERCKNQTLTVDRLVVLAKTKVSWDKPAHREMLQSLWSAVYPDKCMPEPSLNVSVSPGWKDVGFQSNDPCTDFRAMGLLGLHCLCYHGSRYPDRVRTIVHAGRPARDFPYAAVGINLVAALVQMLKLGQQTLQPSAASGRRSQFENTALFDFLCKMPNDENICAEASARADCLGAASAPVPGLGAHDTLTREHPYAFEETFCAAFEMLDDMWVEDPPANILFFNTLLQQCRGLLAQLFEKRGVFSIADLRADIRGHVPSSGAVPRAISQPSSNTSAVLFDLASSSNTSTSISAANTSTSKSSTNNMGSSPRSCHASAAHAPSPIEDGQGSDPGELAAAADRETFEQVDVQLLPSPRPSKQLLESASASGQGGHEGQLEVDPAMSSQHKGAVNSIESKSVNKGPILWAPDVDAPESRPADLAGGAHRQGKDVQRLGVDGLGRNWTQDAGLSPKAEGKQLDSDRTIEHGTTTAGGDAGLTAVAAFAALTPPVRLILDTQLPAEVKRKLRAPPEAAAPQRSKDGSNAQGAQGQGRSQPGSLDASQPRPQHPHQYKHHHQHDAFVKSARDRAPPCTVSDVREEGSKTSATHGARIVPPLVFSDIDRTNDGLTNVFDYPTARAGTPANAQDIVMPALARALDTAPSNEGAASVARDVKSVMLDGQGRPAEVQSVHDPDLAGTSRDLAPAVEGTQGPSPAHADHSSDGNIPEVS